jgi:hypothetical protein
MVMFPTLDFVSFFLLWTFALASWSFYFMLFEKMVFHVIDTIGLVGAHFNALLLDARFTNPSSNNTAALCLLDIMAIAPDPGICFFGLFVSQITRKKPENQPFCHVNWQLGIAAT